VPTRRLATGKDNSNIEGFRVQVAVSFDDRCDRLAACLGKPSPNFFFIGQRFRRRTKFYSYVICPQGLRQLWPIS